MDHANPPECSGPMSAVDSAVGRSLKVIGRGAPEASGCPPLRLLSLLTPQVVEVRQNEVIVGRHSNADLQLLQPDVSRHHCRIYFMNDEWHIGDLGSLNGTSVNDQRVQTAVLRENDVVGIATHMFKVVLETDASAEQDDQVIGGAAA
jgi:pSer/pThr/pTyr-binding forkhead associated (FHA) protein